MYTKYDYKKENFKKDVTLFIQKEGYFPEKIGGLAFTICMENIRKINKDLYNQLMELATMENGTEFEMTEEEFNKFLDDM